MSILRNLIEQFVPANIPADAEYQRRTRLIVYTIFITTLFAFLYVITSWMADFYLAAWIMLGCTSGFVLILFFVKSGVNILIAANLFGLLGVASILVCSYYGGGLHSPTLPWLASTPIVILLLVGKKSGYVWVSISASMVIVFGWLGFKGYPFLKLFPASKDPIFFTSVYFGLILIIFILSVVFENIRIRAQKEIVNQKEAVEDALSRLKTTQNRLIHSEKMAALGELTAGVAHEIQNPLNFVNNFSQVNLELLSELKEEVRTGNWDEIMFLVDAIEQNTEKITHHGSRADAIVKSMQQHSRKSSGQLEPTDVNALVDECLRLSYHAMIGKDKSFNPAFKTQFDSQLDQIHLIRQDVGRVLLNMFNNAFYAVQDKRKQADEAYQPTVLAITKKLTDKVEIRIKDNGTGIPERIRGKIFQPFFTTKPTGQGTGLGLSLSYDIIKTHGGEIDVESKEGLGSEFVIQLPVKEW